MALKDLFRNILGWTVEYGDTTMQSPNEMSSGYKVFISYRRDGGYFIAELLKQYLKSHGIKAYLDLHDLQVLNRRWQDDIETHISMIPIFVLVVTHDMFAHKKDNEAIDWCEFEIGVALKDAQKNILQLVVNENGITVPDNSKKSKDRDIFIENAFHFLDQRYKETLKDYQMSFYSRDYPDASLEEILKRIRNE